MGLEGERIPSKEGSEGINVSTARVRKEESKGTRNRRLEKKAQSGKNDEMSSRPTEDLESSRQPDDESEIQWEERAAIPETMTSKATLKRDEWMLAPPLPPSNIAEEIRKTSDIIGFSVTEMGGTDKSHPRHVENVDKDRSTRFELDRDRDSTIDYGTQDWSLYQVELLKKQADLEGRSIEEIALEKWGSLGHLRALVAQVGKKVINRPQDQSIATEGNTRYTGLQERNVEPDNEILNTRGSKADRGINRIASGEEATNLKKAAEKSEIGITREQELNRLAAKMFKAELSGDTEAKNKLESQLLAERESLHSAATFLPTHEEVSGKFSR